MVALTQAELGSQIKRWRELRQISPEDLANALTYLSLEELIEIEKGEHHIGAWDLGEIAEALNVSALAILNPNSFSAKINLAIVEGKLDEGPRLTSPRLANPKEILQPASYWRDQHAQILEDAHVRCVGQDSVAYCTHLEDATRIREEVSN